MNETLFSGYRQKNIKSKPLTLALFRRLEISDKRVKLAVSGIRETRPASRREALQLELKHEGVLQELGFTLVRSSRHAPPSVLWSLTCNLA